MPTAAGKAEPFSLYTHCGIDELIVDGKWYQREGGRLDDGHGNPPAGWDNPLQPGGLSASGSTVVFRDRPATSRLSGFGPVLPRPPRSAPDPAGTPST